MENGFGRVLVIPFVGKSFTGSGAGHRGDLAAAHANGAGTINDL